MLIKDEPVEKCPRLCDPDCDVECHEMHLVPWKREPCGEMFCPIPYRDGADSAEVTSDQQDLSSEW